jgi:hypothetical protein
VVTISNNKIHGNKQRGVTVIHSRAELAKNEVYENNYGIYAIDCRDTDGNVVSVFGNKVYKNTDGIRLDSLASTAAPYAPLVEYGADASISGNDIYLNNDNGIIAKMCKPFIVSNAIHNNRDDGIHMESCYNAAYWTANAQPSGVPRSRKPNGVTTASPFAGGLDERHIFNNIIAFSGGEGIELTDSSPFINHNHIWYSYDNGVLCLSGSAPFVKNTCFGVNSRAAVACATIAETPIVRYNNFYLNSFYTLRLDSLATMSDMDPYDWAKGLPVASETTVISAAKAGVEENVGFNIRSELYADGVLAPESATLENPFLKTWYLDDLESHSRMGFNGARYLKVDSVATVSQLINAGEPYRNGVALPGNPGAAYADDPDYGVAPVRDPADLTFLNDDIGVIEFNNSITTVETL